MENALNLIFFLTLIISLLFLLSLYQASLFASSLSVFEKTILDGKRNLENLRVELRSGVLKVTNNGVNAVSLRHLYVFGESSIPKIWLDISARLKPGDSIEFNLSELFPTASNVKRVDVVTELGNVFSSFDQNKLMRGVKT